MSELVLLLAVFGPLLLTVWLRKSRWGWLPGLALLALGLWAACTPEHDAGRHGQMGFLALGALAYGGICLIVVATSGVAAMIQRRRPPRAPPVSVSLPEARVIE